MNSEDLTANFHLFEQNTSGISLPDKFTFPFYYEPHQLSVLASNQLKDQLEKIQLQHNFGLTHLENHSDEELVIGKMFGVLVVKNEKNQLGFLQAFSGKLANSNHHEGFVPPVFDILTEDGVFRTGEKELEIFTKQIVELESNPEIEKLRLELENSIQVSNKTIQEIKSEIKLRKKKRDEKRKENLSHDELEALKKESFSEQFYLKKTTSKLKDDQLVIKNKLDLLLNEIEELKTIRRDKSSSIQKQLFAAYSFLNKAGKTKDLNDIFAHIPTASKIAGAGECCAPKLLQYAFINNLEPICIAEFWWGQSPKSEIRVHEHYYPACRGKCEPILGHMLEGIEMDPNPLIELPDASIELPIIYEDEFLLAVNKPAEFLSVPGKTINDSVAERMKKYIQAPNEAFVVHRLDMSTSGILLVAKDLETYKRLQKQFIKHSIKKRYIALLDGEIENESGQIELPLRVDIEDRPRQLVCEEFGKHALTEYEVRERKNGKTLIYFYPKTGRTHQLRVHAAHSLGLNAPIIGDDLYGDKAERLCLHAEWIDFYHPWKKERMQIHCPIEFVF